MMTQKREFGGWHRGVRVGFEFSRSWWGRWDQGSEAGERFDGSSCAGQDGFMILSLQEKASLERKVLRHCQGVL